MQIDQEEAKLLARLVWEELKRLRASDPTKAKRIVMVTEKDIRTCLGNVLTDHIGSLGKNE